MSSKIVQFLFFVIGGIFIYCNRSTTENKVEPAAFNLDGQPLFAPEPDSSILQKLKLYQKSYQEDSTVVDNIIWYGRFLAYTGKYQESINIYSSGITQYPREPKFYRHRGHRYITIRKFARAIADLEQAAKLVAGQPNETEPDGMPNAQNIPVSTLQGNIWYHLGLAYYLNHEYDKALQAYLKCLDSTSNDDNLVSATHWIYTIMCRQHSKGDPLPFLESIHDSLDVIENTGYYRLCRLYKGEMTVKEVRAGISAGAGRDAVDYGIARWYACLGDTSRSHQLIKEIVAHPQWASFGYIAAEADLKSLPE